MEKTPIYVGKPASKKQFVTICQLRRLLIFALTPKKGKDRQNKPQNQQNQATYIGNPTCKKQFVTICQPIGSCSDKIVEKNIKSMQIEWKLKVPHLQTMYSNYSNQVCAQHIVTFYCKLVTCKRNVTGHYLFLIFSATCF
jgi:hypothetical protein